MRPRRRIGRTVTWGGASAAALIGATWAASGWWSLAWIGRRCGAWSIRGGLIAGVAADASEFLQGRAGRSAAAEGPRSSHSFT